MLGWRIADRGQWAKITMGKLNHQVEGVLQQFLQQTFLARIRFRRSLPFCTMSLISVPWHHAYCLANQGWRQWTYPFHQQFLVDLWSSCQTVKWKISRQNVTLDCVWKNTSFHGSRSFLILSMLRTKVVLFYVALVIIYFNALILLHWKLAVNLRLL